METGLKCVCLLLLQFSLLCMIVKIGLMASFIMTILHVLLTFLSATLLLCYVLGVLYIRILVLVIVLLVAGLLLWVMACIFVLLGRLMLPGIMMLLFTLPLLQLCALHFRAMSERLCRLRAQHPLVLQRLGSQALECACGQLSEFAKVLNLREMVTEPSFMLPLLQPCALLSRAMCERLRRLRA